MVSIGLGWSILPKTMIDESLVALDVVKSNLQRPLGYVFHRDKTLSNAASAFVDALEKGRKT
jgi:DNA-binding transcriptional LysR family regulator